MSVFTNGIGVYLIKKKNEGFVLSHSYTFIYKNRPVISNCPILIAGSGEDSK